MSMRSDHQEEKYEHLLWQEDIEHWRSERSRLDGMLKAILAAWSEAESLLESHEKAIGRHRVHVDAHERAIAEYQRSDTDQVGDPLMNEHIDFRARHLHEREIHERIRRQHEATMSEIRELYREACHTGLVPECSPSLE